jgi:GH25 family lysozyme M1 (1,4-beta-N-acetylmuramidase)
MTKQATIEGIDVSYFQGKPDYAKVAESGRKFAIIKASEGANGYDPSFKAHRDAALPHLWVGAYHVLRPNSPVGAQVRNFYERSEGLGEMRMQLPPTLDFELYGPDGAVPKGKLAEIALDFLQRAEELWKCAPMLYTYPWFWKDVASVAKAETLAKFKQYPLWYASYDSVPRCPPQWDSITIHQYAGNNGKCPGVVGACDLNKFHGTETDLRKLMKDPGPFPE